MTALEKLNAELEDFVAELKKERKVSLGLLSKHKDIFGKEDYSTIWHTLSEGNNVSKIKRISKLLKTLDNLENKG